MVLVAGGFVVGAAGAAWRQREVRADPWRKMRVEHEGIKGETTRTRLVFENPALAVQAVEVTRSPEAVPEVARVALRDGRELTVRYQNDTRPTALEGPDGARALLTYDGDKARVEFVGADRKTVGTKAVNVPAELRSSLRDRRAGGSDAPAHSALWKEWLDALV